jgi:hypothetical protein
MYEFKLNFYLGYPVVKCKPPSIFCFPIPLLEITTSVYPKYDFTKFGNNLSLSNYFTRTISSACARLAMIFRHFDYVRYWLTHAGDALCFLLCSRQFCDWWGMSVRPVDRNMTFSYVCKQAANGYRAPKASYNMALITWLEVLQRFPNWKG